MSDDLVERIAPRHTRDLHAYQPGKPVEELPLLFQRILQNAIRDFFRRRKVRNLWTILFSTLGGKREEDDSDPLETLESEAGPSHEKSPEEQVEQSQLIEIIEKEVAKLPARQREAFLLRYWEEFDVAETAAVMGCSEGSVKTHCSRAAHALATALKANTAVNRQPPGSRPSTPAHSSSATMPAVLMTAASRERYFPRTPSGTSPVIHGSHAQLEMPRDRLKQNSSPMSNASRLPASRNVATGTSAMAKMNSTRTPQPA